MLLYIYMYIIISCSNSYFVCWRARALSLWTEMNLMIFTGTDRTRTNANGLNCLKRCKYLFIQNNNKSTLNIGTKRVFEIHIHTHTHTYIIYINMLLLRINLHYVYVKYI